MLLLLLLLASPTLLLAQEQEDIPIINAGFELPDVSPSFQYDPSAPGWTPYSDPLGGSSGWGITTGYNGFMDHDTGGASDPLPPEGVQALFLQRRSFVSQELSGFKAGHQYRLQLQTRKRSDTPWPANDLNVELDGVGVVYSEDVTSSQWQTVSVTFMAHAPSHVLRIFTTNQWTGDASTGNDGTAAAFPGTDRTTFVDDVRVFHILQPTNPLLCEFDDTVEPNMRYYSPTTDGAACPGTPDTSNSCYYPVNALTTDNPTTLRIDGANPDFGVPESRLGNDGTTDRIYLAFDVPTKYYDLSLGFPDATGGECDQWAVTIGYPTATSTTKNACYQTWEFSLPWVDAYAADGSKCGFVRLEEGSDVTLTLEVKVLATEDLGDGRSSALTRDVEFSHPIRIEFPTQVTADTADVQAFAPVRVLTAVLAQQVELDESTDPDTATMTIDLRTEVQAPFELFGITTKTVPAGITLASTLDGNNDGPIRQDTECENGAADCANTWRFAYTTQTTTAPCNFNGAYEVTFSIRCSDSSDTNCPIDVSTDSVTVSFSVASSNHCPSLIDSVDLTAALKVYDTAAARAANGVEQDDFVGDGTADDGQTPSGDDWQVAYFAAPTYSTQVAIQTTEFNQVVVERTSGDIVLLDKDDTLAYDGVGAIQCSPAAFGASITTFCDPERPASRGGGSYNFDFGHRQGGPAQAGGSAGGDVDSIPWFQFDVRTDSEGFALADDAIETMTITAVIDVSYANAAKRLAKSGDVVQDTRGVVSQSVTTSITASEPIRSSSTSSTSTVFGMNATVVFGAAAVAIISIVTLFALVIRRRSRRRPAVDLHKSSSTAEFATV